MDGARKGGEGRSERTREGATERGSGSREERGRKGDMEGGKLQRRYPEEDTGQYTQYTAHKTRHNAAFAIATLSLWYYKYKIINGYLTPYKLLDGYPASFGFHIMHRVHAICTQS